MSQKQGIGETETPFSLQHRQFRTGRKYLKKTNPNGLVLLDMLAGGWAVSEGEWKQISEQVLFVAFGQRKTA